MIGYKATDKDGKCRGFQFEVGKTYTKNTPKEDLECCTDKVFHFCRELISCGEYYNLEESRIFEVIAGDYIKDGDNYGTNSLTILRELTEEDRDIFLNSGNRNSGSWNSGSCNGGNRNSGSCNGGSWNSGDCNSGSCNSGNRNSGDCNSGSCNSGNRNSGDCNSGSWNSGFFNTNEPKVRMFNKDTNFMRDEIHIPYWCYFDLTEWVSHDTATEKEKEKYKKEIEISGGFLKTLDYKEAWKIAYNKTNDEEKKQLFKLPNYDCEVFEEITGIDTKVDFERLMKE